MKGELLSRIFGVLLSAILIAGHLDRGCKEMIKETVFTILIVLITTCAAWAQNVMKRFDFGPGKTASGYTQVQSTDNYAKDRGFGFEPGSTIICIDRRRNDALRSDFCTSQTPFLFSVAVAEGNYKVTVTFGDDETATSTVVKAELRRLMLENVDTQKGKFVSRSFIVNVRNPQISTGGEVRLKDREKTSERWAWDEKLTLEFNGSGPTVNAIEIEKVDVPTVFLLGDSTVCDQPAEPYASWGQMITRFFGDKVAIANHAESGESLKSSFGAKRLDKVLSQIKPGDFLLIQYGHNDEKEKGDGIGAFTSYKSSLKQFTEAAKAKGGSVILVNPMHRRTFDANGKITNSHGDYPEAVRQAAKEENVPLIDLTAMSQDLYEALGKDGSGVLFKEGDGTHHNNYGSYQLAKTIVQAIRDQKLSLAKFLIKGLPKYDPKKPDDRKTFTIPASPAVTDSKPLEN
jgi:lysophospholipase L1-like esterase